jgi:hypothetical protein
MMVRQIRTILCCCELNVTAEEDLREAMEKVTTYNEAESRKIASIAR